MTDLRTPLVWRVSVGRLSSSDTVMERAKEHGWEVKAAECLRMTSQEGRQANILQRRDAAKLYEDLHRYPVAVIYDKSPRVRTNPRPPFLYKRTVSLFQFCRYKCYANSLDSATAKNWDHHFEKWC